MCCLQEHAGALKVVKVEHDPNKSLVEKYKVCSQLERWRAALVLSSSGGRA
jgi:hypothetical protein